MTIRESKMGAWFEDESFWSELYPFMFPEERFQLAEEQIEKVLTLVGYKEGTVSSTEGGDGVLLIQRHEICEDWTRCRNEWILVKGATARTFNFQTRLYSGQEMKDMLQRAGFEEVKVFGDLDGNKYGIDADRLIAVGRKNL